MYIKAGVYNLGHIQSALSWELVTECANQA